MLLRRYMEHLRDQNWTAVWLDLVVVVVGIFLGLQVLDWNYGFASAIGLDIDTDHLDYSETDVRNLRGVEKLAEHVLVTAPKDQLTSKPVRDAYAVAFPLRGNYLAHLGLFLKQVQETRELVAGERARLGA